MTAWPFCWLQLRPTIQCCFESRDLPWPVTSGQYGAQSHFRFCDQLWPVYCAPRSTHCSRSGSKILNRASIHRGGCNNQQACRSISTQKTGIRWKVEKRQVIDTDLLLQHWGGCIRCQIKKCFNSTNLQWLVLIKGQPEKVNSMFQVCLNPYPIKTEFTLQSTGKWQQHTNNNNIFEKRKR